MFGEENPRMRQSEDVQALKTRINQLESELNSVRAGFSESLDKICVLFDILPNGLVVLNKQGEILYANVSAAFNLGYDRDEFLSLNISEIDSTESRSKYVEHFEDMCQGKRLHYETVHKKKDGSILYVDVISRVFTLQGQRVTYNIWQHVASRELNNVDIEKFRKEIEKPLYAKIKDLENTLSQKHLETSQYKTLDGSLEALKTDLEGLKKTLALRENELRELKRSSGEKDDAGQKAFEEKNRRISELEKQLSEKESDLRNSIDGKTRELDMLKKRLEDEGNAGRSAIQLKENKISEMKKQLSENEDDIRKGLEEKNREVSGLKKQLDEGRAAEEGLKNSLEEKNREIAGLIKRLEDAGNLGQGVLEEKNNKISELEAQLSEKKSFLRINLEGKNRELDVLKKRLEDEGNAGKAAIQSKENKISELEKQLSEQKKQLSEQGSMMRNSLEEKTRESEQLRKQLADKKVIEAEHKAAQDNVLKMLDEKTREVELILKQKEKEIEGLVKERDLALKDIMRLEKAKNANESAERLEWTIREQSIKISELTAKLEAEISRRKVIEEKLRRAADELNKFTGGKVIDTGGADKNAPQESAETKNLEEKLQRSKEMMADLEKEYIEKLDRVNKKLEQEMSSKEKKETGQADSAKTGQAETPKEGPGLGKLINILKSRK